MKKPNWEIQNKEVIVKPVDLPGFLDLFRLESRGSKFKGSHWMIAINKKTGKILMHPGTRKHIQFSDSEEAIAKVAQLILDKELKL